MVCYRTESLKNFICISKMLWNIIFYYFFYFQQGQTALSIAQKLNYISVVETLKVVTETIVTTTTTTVTEEKYRVVAPETMQEAFMSDSEEEGGKIGKITTYFKYYFFVLHWIFLASLELMLSLPSSFHSLRFLATELYFFLSFECLFFLP